MLNKKSIFEKIHKHLLIIAAAGIIMILPSSNQSYAMLQGPHKRWLITAAASAMIIGVVAIVYEYINNKKLKKKLRDNFIQNQRLFGENINLTNHQVVGNTLDLPHIQPNEIQQIKQILMHNPLKLLQKNIKVIEKFEENILTKPNKQEKESGVVSEERAVMVAKYLHKSNKSNPLCMLGECYQPSCGLTRDSDKTNARTKFETTVIAELHQQAYNNNNNNSLTLVNVGSGLLFQDLVFVTNTFERDKKIETMNLVLIDPCYGEYIKHQTTKDYFKNFQKMPQQRESESGISFGEYANLIKKTFAFTENTHAIITQLSHWFAQAYPTHTLKIFLYDSVNSYTQDVETNFHLKANVYVGADLKTCDPFCTQIPNLLNVNDDEKGEIESYLSVFGKVITPGGIGLMLLNRNIELNKVLDRVQLSDPCKKIPCHLRILAPKQNEENPQYDTECLNYTIRNL